MIVHKKICVQNNTTRDFYFYCKPLLYYSTQLHGDFRSNCADKTVYETLWEMFVLNLTPGRLRRRVLFCFARWPVIKNIKKRDNERTLIRADEQRGTGCYSSNEPVKLHCVSTDTTACCNHFIRIMGALFFCFLYLQPLRVRFTVSFSPD